MARSSNKKSFLELFKFNDSDDEFDDDLFDEDDDDEDDDFDTKPERTKPAYSSASTSQRTQTAQKKQKPVKQARTGGAYGGNSKLVSINNSRPQYSSQQVFVVKPDGFDDAQMIIEHIKSGQAIVINMEGFDPAIGQRIIDIIGGACMALDGTLQGISGNIFIAAPSEIYVSGDLRDELLSESSLSPQLGGF